MSDYPQFMSDSATEFSKGPKSLYKPSGSSSRVILDGVILNVPQTDEDDEWGRTERVAWESLIDKIGKLEHDVENPILLEDSLNGRMTALVGTTTRISSTPLIDLSAPSFTLGTITVNGSTNKITVSTTTELSATGLSTGVGTFTGSVTADSLNIAGTSISTIAGSTFRITGSVNHITTQWIDTEYIYVSNTLQCESTTNLLGPTVTMAVAPVTDAIYDIGSSSPVKNYRDLYLSGNINAATATFTGNVSIANNGSTLTNVSIGNTSSVTTLSLSSNVFIAGNLYPSVDNTYYLGKGPVSGGSVPAPYYYWKALFTKDLVVSASGDYVTGTSEINGSIRLNATFGTASASSTGIAVRGGSSFYIGGMGPLGLGTINIGTSTSDRITKLWSSDVDTTILTATTSNLTTAYITNLLPSVPSVSNLGSVGANFNSLFLAGTATMLGLTVGTVAVSTVIRPSVNNSTNIGTSAIGFKYLYMSDPSTGTVRKCWADGSNVWHVEAP